MNSVSIIVPTYGKARFLVDAVRSLSAQNCLSQFEIVIVDNNPSDELHSCIASLLTAKEPEIRYVVETRTGLHYARHTGARSAQGDIVVFVDDDVLIPQGWLDSMLMPYCDPLVACVGGKTVAKWESEPPEWISLFVGGWFSILNLGGAVKVLNRGEYVYGCNMSVRRDVLFKSGGFNPDGYGDPKLIWYRGNGECGLIEKIQDLGLKVIYEPRAWLYHRIPMSRTTEKYLYRRAFTDGISLSYTRYRRDPAHWLGLLNRISCDALRWGYWWIRSFLQHGCYEWIVRKRMVVQEYKAKTLHGLMLLFKPELRAHVTRLSYLDE